ncbi:MAG: DUF433 domain-containing protein [Verrucomicrobia bacterium]|nr:DUF433 domain-containing protein [Verrucomicrobiota bacterium]
MKTRIALDAASPSPKPVFAGTQVPADALIGYIRDGKTLDDFLRDFPVVDRQAALDFLDALARHTTVLAQPRAEMLDELYDVYLDCRERNWDGYGAEPISYDAYLAAQKFIEAWLLTLPTAEISAAANGEISFEWYLAPDKIVSVGVSGDRVLSYASIFGPHKAHGTEPLTDEIPAVVIAHVQRLAPPQNAK